VIQITFSVGGPAFALEGATSISEATMGPRTALALAAVATTLVVRPVAAAPIDHSIGMLSNNAAYFQTLVNAVDGGGRRAKGDSASGGLIGGGHAGRLYAVGGAAMLGVVAAFILDSHHANQDELLDPPVIIPGGDDPQGGGTQHDVVNPNLPGTLPGTTVTPEPGTLLLLSTGVSTLGAAAVRRRRKLH
jgi:hypothetical protein